MKNNATKVIYDPLFFIYTNKKNMKKWSKEEEKYAIYLIENGLSHKDIAKNLNRTVRSIQRRLNDLGYHSVYRLTTLYQILNCKYCGEEFKSLKSENRKFCSKNCQLKSINSIKKDYNKTKIVKCTDCKCDIKIKINANISNCRCKNCKNKQCNQCKYCGEILNTNVVCKDCKPYIQNISLFKKLGIELQNKKLNILNKEAINILSEMYYDKKYSRLQMSEILNIDKKTLYKFFIKNNFNLRSLSESVSNSIYQGRLTYNEIKNQYKSGWHKTWNNTDVYCRSSYELDYCSILDEKKEEYYMEKIRIKYWDSIKKKERLAIPDFYLPNKNEIVEIKSDWTYDEQNMNDKIIAYKNAGYNIKIILEHIEYLIK
jgi:hypothetical protein